MAEARTPPCWFLPFPPFQTVPLHSHASQPPQPTCRGVGQHAMPLCPGASAGLSVDTWWGQVVAYRFPSVLSPASSAGLLVAGNGERGTWGRGRRGKELGGHKEWHCPTEGDSPGVTWEMPLLPTFPLLSLQVCSSILASGQSIQPLSMKSWPTLSITGKCPGLGVSGEAAGALAPPEPHEPL